MKFSDVVRTPNGIGYYVGKSPDGIWALVCIPSKNYTGSRVFSGPCIHEWFTKAQLELTDEVPAVINRKERRQRRAK